MTHNNNDPGTSAKEARLRALREKCSITLDHVWEEITRMKGLVQKTNDIVEKRIDEEIEKIKNKQPAELTTYQWVTCHNKLVDSLTKLTKEWVELNERISGSAAELDEADASLRETPDQINTRKAAEKVLAFMAKSAYLQQKKDQQPPSQ